MTMIATIIIITGDINFVPDIADLNNRKKYNVVLIYPEQVLNNQFNSPSN